MVAQPDSLIEAYKLWRNRPFPPGSSNDKLDEFHAKLALADEWLMATVIPFVEHGQHVAAKIDILGRLRGLDVRVEELGQSIEGPDRILLDAYRDYLDCQRRVYEELLAKVAGA